MIEEEIYTKLYRVISDQYDIRNSLLSIVIRDCVVNEGAIPTSSSSSEIERQCPGVLDMICKSYFSIIADGNKYV
tara:strand:+ start:2995 stop:3219 length:225 start_codon:yes stop_codon:yes gene_type:complete